MTQRLFSFSDLGMSSRDGLNPSGSAQRDHPLALQTEELRNVLNGHADLMANCLFLGPTALDFSMLPDSGMVPASEAKQLKAWKARDLASFYVEQRSNKYR